jgi:hypothetical protein
MQHAAASVLAADDLLLLLLHHLDLNALIMCGAKPSPSHDRTLWQ